MGGKLKERERESARALFAVSSPNSYERKAGRGGGARSRELTVSSRMCADYSTKSVVHLSGRS